MAKPWVTAALLCERVIQEKDESLSLVRIIDRIQYELQGVPAGTKPMINVQGLVSIKAGPVTGEHVIKLVASRPDGDRRELYSQTVTLLGSDQAQNIIVHLGIGVEVDGLYWFDVVFDDEVLSRIPVTITRLETPVPQAKN